MAKLSDARHRANEKYNAKAYDQIMVRVAKGRRAEIQAYARANGETVNEMVNRLIDAEMKQDRDKS